MILVEQNPMLEKMKRGEPVLGCQVRSRSTLIAEMIAYGGLDYVFIEGEHFVHNVETAENLIRAVQAADVVPIVIGHVNEAVPALTVIVPPSAIASGPPLIVAVAVTVTLS